MTAEIGILNREAVALAADSAITSGEKIFPSANKIFMLSKYHPVGIMVYGSAYFMNTPWETVVKVYRRHIGQRSFSTLREYADDFLNFLSQDRRFSPPAEQDRYVIGTIVDEFHEIRTEVDRVVQAVIQAQGEIQTDIVKTVVDEMILRRHVWWKDRPYPDHFPADLRARLRSDYSEHIADLKGEFFQDLLTAATSRRLSEIAVHVVTKMTSAQRGPRSGAVIAGFGEQELYPKLYEFAIDSVIRGHLKYQERRKVEVGAEGEEAAIVPFAQGEMVYLFMEGIDLGYQKELEEFFHDVIVGFPNAIADSLRQIAGDEKVERFMGSLKRVGEQLAKRYDEELQQRRRSSYRDTIISVVAMLPRGELASAAESLVNLTSFKRRVSREAETVGGPIDVALISKGDGFIWIRRKHYFRSELNHQFFSNYFQKVEPHERQDGD